MDLIKLAISILIEIGLICLIIYFMDMFGVIDLDDLERILKDIVKDEDKNDNNKVR